MITLDRRGQPPGQHTFSVKSQIINTLGFWAIQSLLQLLISIVTAWKLPQAICKQFSWWTEVLNLMYSNLSGFSFVFLGCSTNLSLIPKPILLCCGARSSHTDICDVPCECVALRVIPLSPPLHYHLWHKGRMSVYRAVCSGFVLFCYPDASSTLP